jgi:GH25 family lysozyme M1 (1,4-beta-N-acetylmuramidase)
MAPAGALSNAVQGVDVASYQESGGINWPAVASAGKQFAAIKATEGDYYRNGYALSDLAAAKAAGLAVVAYAFAIPNGGGSSASPVTQADDIVNYLKSGPAGVPPIMLDIEYDPYSDGTNSCYGLSQSAMGTWVKDFAAEVKAKTGNPAIIYTTQGWWNACVGTTVSLGSNPLWVAAYNASSNPGTLPDGWSSGDWTYWQYSSTGGVSGIGGGVDLDQLNPKMLTLLNPGDQQDQANGGPITPVQLHASQNATYSAAGLPASLTMTSGGLITGTAPTSIPATPSIVTVTATSGSASQSVTFTWYWHGTLSVTQGNLTTVGGSPVDLQVQPSDSPAEPPVMFSAPTQSPVDRLPPGLSISNSGRITGWPDRPGIYQVTVYAADGLEAAGSTTFTWTVSIAADTGPRGAVHLDLGGLCLDDPGNSSKAGTVADVRTCNAGSAQNWTYAQDDSVRINSMCLQSPSTRGAKVQLETCTGQADQQWQLVYPASVNHTLSGAVLALYNPGYGMCLSDPGNSKTNGTQQIAWPCYGYKGQEWTLQAGPVQSGIAGKCLDDYKNLTANGNKVDESTCHGGAAQKWAAHTDGTVRINGKCLDVRNGGTASGTRVELYSCNGGTAQQWHLIADGSGVLLQNPRSGLCLADPGDSTVSGTQLQIRRCTATDPGMAWRVS